MRDGYTIYSEEDLDFSNVLGRASARAKLTPEEYQQANEYYERRKRTNEILDAIEKGDDSVSYTGVEQLQNKDGKPITTVGFDYDKKYGRLERAGNALTAVPALVTNAIGDVGEFVGLSGEAALNLASNIPNLYLKGADYITGQDTSELQEYNKDFGKKAGSVARTGGDMFNIVVDSATFGNDPNKATSFDNVKDADGAIDKTLTGTSFAIENMPQAAASMLMLKKAPFVLATSMTSEIANTRARNNGEVVTAENYAEALPFTVFSLALDKFSLNKLLGSLGRQSYAAKSGLKQVAKSSGVREVGKATLREGATEGVQGGIEAFGGMVGTEKGVDGQKIIDSSASGALVGAPLGGGIQAGVNVINNRRQRELLELEKREQERQAQVEKDKAEQEENNVEDVFDESDITEPDESETASDVDKSPSSFGFMDKDQLLDLGETNPDLANKINTAQEFMNNPEADSETKLAVQEKLNEYYKEAGIDPIADADLSVDEEAESEANTTTEEEFELEEVSETLMSDFAVGRRGYDDLNASEQNAVIEDVFGSEVSQYFQNKTKFDELPEMMQGQINQYRNKNNTNVSDIDSFADDWNKKDISERQDIISETLGESFSPYSLSDWGQIDPQSKTIPSSKLKQKKPETLKSLNDLGVIGKESRVLIGKKKYKTELVLVDADDLVANVEKNDAQFRDRKSAASQQQVKDISSNIIPELLDDVVTLENSAPTLTNDNQIVAGNGRTLAIQDAYANNPNQAKKYTKFLKQNAERYGFKKSDFDGINKPVMVRRLKNKVNVKSAAIKSNISNTLQTPAIEQSKIDAERLGNIELFDSSKPIYSNQNADFVRSFDKNLQPEERSSLYQSDGTISQEGSKRMENALLYKAYGDSKTLENIIESTDADMKNLQKSLLKAAPKIAKAKDQIGKGELEDGDISQEIVEAATRLEQARAQGNTVDDYLAQKDMFNDGISDTTQELMRYFEQNLKSQKALSEVIEKRYDDLIQKGSPKQETLFDEPASDAEDIVSFIRQKLGNNRANKLNIVANGEVKNKGDKKLSVGDLGAEGYHDRKTGETYVFLDNIQPFLDENGNVILSKKERALWVAWHEAFHRGMSVQGSKQYANTLKKAGRNKFVESLAKAINEARGGNLTELEAIEEALAEIRAAMELGKFNSLQAQYGVKQPQSDAGIMAVVSRWFNAVKNAIRTIVGRDVRMTDQEVMTLIKRIGDLDAGDIDTVSNQQSGEVDLNARRFSVPRETSETSPVQSNTSKPKAPNGKDSNLTQKQWEQVRTPEFKEWFGDWENDPENASKVVDENGEPLVVYHGTTNDFNVFDSEKKGNIGGHFGKVNYFTDSYNDAYNNYLADGADLTTRIEIESEIIEYEISDLDKSEISAKYGIDINEISEFQDSQDIANYIAKNKLDGGTERVIDLFINSKNPIYIGSEPQYFEAYDIEEYIEEAAEYVADEYGVSKSEAKEDYFYDVQNQAMELGGENLVVEALTDALLDNGYTDISASEILEDAGFESEVDLSSVEQKIRNAELYENFDGDIASSQVISDFFMNLGFDSIVLQDPSQRFPNMGISENTNHYHVFNNKKSNIKSATDNTGAFSKDTDDIRYSLPPKANIKSIQVTLSASTGTIKGIDALQKRVLRGDKEAAELLNNIAYDSIKRLTDGIKDVNISKHSSIGLYDGYQEASLGLDVSFNQSNRAEVLASLERFARNFNQQQIHVRQNTNESVGTTFEDGSFVTPSYKIDLKKPLSKSQLDEIVKKSGLDGVTANDNYIEFYYIGSPKDAKAIRQFKESAKRASELVGENGRGIDKGVKRIWRYGDRFNENDRPIGYEQIRGFVHTSKAGASQTAKRVAEYISGRRIIPADQKSITPEQRKLQERIRDAYDAMPVDDLKNGNVRKAYRELAEEVVEQFNSMPIKVEVLSGQGEPYANSEAMRRDILDNNHLFIFGTEKYTFGSSSLDYENHPLLKDSGEKDINGYPLLVNDMFRAVHDYYAHTISPVQFGAKGEEAAWKNHMAMMKSPWAAWALTSETRGQNSWVNFRDGIEDIPLAERGFADQKVGLLPIEFSYTGDADVDAKMKNLESRIDRTNGSLENNPDFKKDDKKNLVVMHNITADGLINADRIGGLPVPSIAIGKSNLEFTGFGEITLIADKRLVDPRLKGNNTFGSDVYSPRYPTIQNEIDRKKFNEIFQDANDLLDKYGLPESSAGSMGLDYARVGELRRSTLAQAAFLLKKGDAPRPKYIKDDSTPKSFRKYAGRDYQMLAKDPAFQKQVIDHYLETKGEEFTNEIFSDRSRSYNMFSHFARQASNYQAKKPDYHANTEAVRKKINSKKYKDEYADWVDRQFDRIVKTQRIDKGYTPSGSKKYKPNTLDNLVKEIRGNIAGGEDFGGVGQFRGVVTPKFRSIEQIQGERDKIISSDELSETKKLMSDKYYELKQKLKPYWNYSGFVDDGSLTDFARTGSLSDFTDVPLELRAELNDFISDLKDAPSEYFESKPQRAVGLDEFTTAIVPLDTRKKVIDVLEKNGLKVKKYNQKNAGDRAKKVDVAARQDGVLFSLSPKFKAKPKKKRLFIETANVMRKAGLAASKEHLKKNSEFFEKVFFADGGLFTRAATFFTETELGQNLYDSVFDKQGELDRISKKDANAKDVYQKFKMANAKMSTKAENELEPMVMSMAETMSDFYKKVKDKAWYANNVNADGTFNNGFEQFMSDLDKIGKYYFHGKERNISMALKSGDTAGSGLSMAEIDDLIAEFDKGIPEMVEFYRDVLYPQHIKKILEYRDQVLDDAGLLTPEMKQARYDWDWYVPLQGEPEIIDSFTGKVLTDAENRQRSGGREAYNRLKNKVSRAEGRKGTEANSIFQNVIDESYKSIRRAGMQEAKKALYEYSKTPKAKDTMGIRTTKTSYGSKKQFTEDVDGNLVFTMEKINDVKADVVAYQDGADVYLMEVKNRKAVDAMKGVSDSLESTLAILLNSATRKNASLWTTYSPPFQLVNKLRDSFQQYLLILADAPVGMESKSYGDAIKNVFGQRLKVANQAAKNNARYTASLLSDNATKQEYLSYLERLRQEGGITTFSRLLSKESLVNLEREIMKGAGIANRQKIVDNTLDWFESVADNIELSSRVAMFKALTDNGVSDQDAAMYVKDVMNFETKGESVRKLGVLYAFATTIAYDVQRLGKALSTKEGQVVFGAVFGARVMLDMLLSELSPEDEDGMSMYDKLPLSQAITNTNFLFGDRGEGIKIPMGWGMERLASGTATILRRFALGTIKADEAASYIASDVIMRNISPVSVSQVEGDFLGKAVQTITPTIALPFAQMFANQSYNGNLVHKSESFLRKDETRAESGFDWTQDSYKLLAKMVERTIGVDMFPENYRLLMRSYMPMANEVGQVVEFGVDTAMGNTDTSTTLSKIPVVSKFNSFPPRYDQRLFWSRFNEIQEDNRKYLSRKKSGDDVSEFDDKKTGMWMTKANAVKKRLNSVNKRSKRAKENLQGDELRERLIKLENEERIITMQFNRLWEKENGYRHNYTYPNANR